MIAWDCVGYAIGTARKRRYCDKVPPAFASAPSGAAGHQNRNTRRARRRPNLMNARSAPVQLQRNNRLLVDGCPRCRAQRAGAECHCLVIRSWEVLFVIDLSGGVGHVATAPDILKQDDGFSMNNGIII